MFDRTSTPTISLNSRTHLGNSHQLREGISSLSELFQVLTSFNSSPSDPIKCLFRGEAKEYTNTVGLPTFARYCLDDEIETTPTIEKYNGTHHVTCLSQQEVELIRRFQIAPPINDIFHLLTDEIDHPDWFAFAQHQGITTRLLDVTKSPLVACYFACASHDNEDGYLLLYLDPIEALRPGEEITNYRDFFDLVIEEDLVTQRNNNQLENFPFEEGEYAHWFERYISYESIRTNDRMNAQQGAFLWSANPFMSLNTNNCVIKIQSSAKISILSELSLFNITAEGLGLI